MLRFCLDAFPSGWSAAQIRGDAAAIRAAIEWTLELGRIADAAEVDSLWLAEDPEGWDAFAVLGAIARETERLRLGTGVVNPYFRHPVQIASAVSTLDLLSNGRAFLGFGRGQNEWYGTALGLEVGNPTRRLVESIELFRQWWSPERTARSPDNATELHVRHWEHSLRPVQDRVPIYLAAVGDRALRIAGEHADGVLFNDLASRDFLRHAIDRVRSAARDAGRDPDALVFASRSGVTITDDVESVYASRKATVATIHALPHMERLMMSDDFDIARIIADVRAAMRTEEILARGGNFMDLRRGGDMAAAKAAIPDDLMRELVVAGSVRDVRRQLAELEGIGITHVFLAGPKPGTSVSSLADLMSSIQPGGAIPGDE